ncbi:hypothetical protein DPMN_069203 [Dreissena polymorpha]|uniref:Uncharacterized protein n=1 Tax=Dreissena polymorpha TaxID=45954 RepID=A0A9D3Z3Y8_DREPO|nr:hypothetical protein DPMN_069203 [Dreissena polymorpha]
MRATRSGGRVDKCYCNLGKNSVYVGVKALTDPEDPLLSGSGGAYRGNNGVSNGAFLKLIRGDTGQLVECSDASSVESYSSLSGVLIKAD